MSKSKSPEDVLNEAYAGKVLVRFEYDDPDEEDCSRSAAYGKRINRVVLSMNESREDGVVRFEMEDPEFDLEEDPYAYGNEEVVVGEANAPTTGGE